MKFTIQREKLLKPLQLIIGVVERRQTMPILSHALLKTNSNQLSLVATDLEVEVTGTISSDEVFAESSIAVPAHKLLDVTRALPEKSNIEASITGQKLILTCGKSRFTLMTLPSADFPLFATQAANVEFTISQKDLRYLIEQVHFSMAQQDVRYYLNGLLFEVGDGFLRALTSDGHRLSLCSIHQQHDCAKIKILIPRKGITELLRLLENEGTASIAIGENFIRVSGDNFSLTSKLIDAAFPDYEKLLFRQGSKQISLHRDELKQTLARVAVLAHATNHIVKLSLRTDKLIVEATNSEHEEARDEIDIDYKGDELDIGFNVTYLLNAVNALPATQLTLTFSDGNSSVLIEEKESNCQYIIMPMRL